MWMIFLAYLLVRQYGGPGSAKLGAAMALFGMANVPFVYVSVNIWRTLHPTTRVVPQLAPENRGPFWFSVVAFLLLYLAVLARRVRLEERRARPRGGVPGHGGLRESGRVMRLTSFRGTCGIGPTARRLVCALVIVCWWPCVRPSSRARQQPPGQSPPGFEPVTDQPPQDQLPAAPLLVAAYIVVWLVLLVYLWTIWRRLRRVEREVAELEAPVGRR